MISPTGPLRPRVSSPYGWPRSSGPHRGVDLACNPGTPLYGWGRVVRLDTDPEAPNGLAVWLESEGVRVAYLHMSRIDVSVGEEPAGVVGLSGSTGDSTGPHVHIGCWTQGETSAQRRQLDPAAVWGFLGWSVYGVRLVQRALGVAVDGVYGVRTEAALFDLQDRRGLARDPWMGPETARVLGLAA
jgi:murein DD-endopeptidase MepM/ murein hydrolase activator NlpD